MQVDLDGQVLPKGMSPNSDGDNPDRCRYGSDNPEGMLAADGGHPAVTLPPTEELPGRVKPSEGLRELCQPFEDGLLTVGMEDYPVSWCLFLHMFSGDLEVIFHLGPIPYLPDSDRERF